jgi:hypothetical protein
MFVVTVHNRRLLRLLSGAPVAVLTSSDDTFCPKKTRIRTVTAPAFSEKESEWA